MYYMCTNQATHASHVNVIIRIINTKQNNAEWKTSEQFYRDIINFAIHTLKLPQLN